MNLSASASSGMLAASTTFPEADLRFTFLPVIRVPGAAGINRTVTFVPNFFVGDGSAIDSSLGLRRHWSLAYSIGVQAIVIQAAAGCSKRTPGFGIMSAFSGPATETLEARGDFRSRWLPQSFLQSCSAAAPVAEVLPTRDAAGSAARIHRTSKP